MPLDDVKHVVLILSGKGGVGKSSVTSQLALSLSLAGKSVGILDVDLTGPSIPRLLGLEDAKITQTAGGGWQPVLVHAAQSLPAVTLPSGMSTNGDSNPALAPLVASSQQVDIGPLYAASLGFLLPSRSSAVVWRGPKKTAMVRQFLSDVSWSIPACTPTQSTAASSTTKLDYLLVDTPPGTSDEHISLAETLLSQTTTIAPSFTTNSTQATTATTAGTAEGKPHLAGAVVVTTPQAVSLSDVRKELNFCAKVRIPVLGVLENMSGFLCECCGERAELFGGSGSNPGESGGHGDKGRGQGGDDRNNNNDTTAQNEEEANTAEKMAQDFNVPLLAKVPVDLGWGRVVEEGGLGWPVTNTGTEGNSTESGVKGDGQGQGDAGSSVQRAQGPLVQRYRTCLLSDVFAEVARDVIKASEGTTLGV